MNSSIDAINAQAAAEHWKLVWTINNGTSHPFLEIVGVGVSNVQAQQHVISRAKSFSAFHTRVLRDVVASRTPQPKKTRKSK